jgi:two-component system cell cycle sensor histidine kinase/response regulator CckA
MQPLLNQVVIALEHARLYREVQDGQERIRQSQKMEAVGQLTAGIAHNFNNMLQGIMSNIRLALMDAPEDLHQPLDDAETTAQRAADIVRQLMVFTHKTKGEFQPVDLQQIVGAAADICRKTFDRKIAVDFDLLPRTPVILGDAAQFEQVLLNILLNARDALGQTAEPRIDIGITTCNFTVDELQSQSHATPGNYIRVRITDNGCGMDEQTRGRIFEPFFSTKEVGQGTGLGLATSYIIVESHRGWIDCSSEAGVGTQFSIYLPATSQSAAPQVEIPVPREPIWSGTILVIDDEEVVRVSVVRMLERAGFTAVPAANGPLALEIFAHAHAQIDLVLLNLSMPLMSGREVLTRLRQTDPHVKVILFSGYAIGQTDFDGVQAIIEKPVTYDRLLQTLGQVMTVGK